MKKCILQIKRSETENYDKSNTNYKPMNQLLNTHILLEDQKTKRSNFNKLKLLSNVERKTRKKKL